MNPEPMSTLDQWDRDNRVNQATADLDGLHLAVRNLTDRIDALERTVDALATDLEPLSDLLRRWEERFGSIRDF